MADLIKKIKIKKQDGTFTDYIPIGAEAQNITTSDGDSVQLKLNKKPYYYNSVANMKADLKLKAGDMAITLGYYEADDGGYGEYRIVSGTYTDDGGSYHQLNNNLYAELIVKNNEIDIKQFGAKGDGVANNNIAFSNIFTFCKNSNLIRKVIFSSGTFIISQGFIIDFSNFTMQGLAGNLIKYVGDGTSGNIIEVLGINADDYIENILIENIKIDGTEQLYKGGYSMETPTVTHTNPAYRGLTCVRADYCKNLNILNNEFNDIYGDGIIGRYCANVIIKNNRLSNVSSGNIDQGSQTGYDNHGDGIATFFSYNVIIDSNSVINRRLYQAGTTAAIGKLCGRSGLEFEYAINQDASVSNPDDPTKNAPGYSDIQTELIDGKDVRYGVGLRMVNNYVYGYTKGIHLESRIKCIIANNTILKNHIGIMASIHNYTSFSGNYFNTMGVGEAPQSGYNLYYGGLAISEYASDERRFGIIASNNTFAGEGKGITIASNYVTIIGNRFNCDRGIYTQKTGLTGINISNNTFNSDLADNFEFFAFLYNVLSARIIGNTFFGTTFSKLDLSGNNITINENEFVNTAIYHHNGTNYITVRDNLFKGNLFTDSVLWINNGNYSVIDNNTFDITDFNTNDKTVARFAGSTTHGTFTNNKFSVTSTRSDLQIVRFETITNCVINNNKYLSNNDFDFIRMYITLNCEIKNNSVENTASMVFHHYGSFEGNNIYENNIGKLDGSGYKPNDSLSLLTGSFYQLSQRVYKYNINSNSTNIGWICVSQGWYANDSWATGTSYNVGSFIKNASNNIYKCVTKGSENSTYEPTHTTTEDVTELDGYKWRYLGPIAVLKDLPL